MDKIISVHGLTREFKIYKRKPGLTGYISTLFSTDYYKITAVN